jgi:predicted hydrolase (HD superfamily)
MNTDNISLYGREQAWELLTQWTQSESLRKHALAVEACVAACGEAEADRLGLAGAERDALV